MRSEAPVSPACRAAASRAPRRVSCAVVALGLAGCIHISFPFSHGTAPAFASGPSSSGGEKPTMRPGMYFGAVRVIGTANRFVLIEVPPALFGFDLTDGQPLVTRGVKTPATLRISTVRKPPFVVADVLSGEPNVGDEVVVGAEPTPGSSPVPAAQSPGPASSPAESEKTPDFRADPGAPAPAPQ